jgi:hypothetical protein
MGDKIRHSLPDHVELNMEPQRTHNCNVHSQRSSGRERVGQRWAAPDMWYRNPGGGGPNMEHARPNNWLAHNMRYSHPGGGGPNMEHHDDYEVPIVGHGGHTTEPVHTNNLGIRHVMINDQYHVSCELEEDLLDRDVLDRIGHFYRALDVATSEKEHRERVERGRKRWAEILNAQVEHNRLKRGETDEHLQKRAEEKAEEKQLDAVNKAKYKAFIEFKQLVTTKRRTALFLANTLHKLLKYFLFQRDHKVVWVRYCQKKVAAQKVVIWLCKNSIRRLREIKMNAMVSLGKWICISNTTAADYVCNAASGGNTTQNDADSNADADTDDVKAATAVGAATDTNADDDAGAEILINLRKTSAADGPSASAANATAVVAVNTAIAVGNSIDNVDDNYADADADNAKAAAAVGAVAAHVDCKIKCKCTLMNQTKTDECMTIDNKTTNKRKMMNCAMMEDTTMEKQLLEYPTVEDHMTMNSTTINCTTMDDHTTINPENPTMEYRMTMDSTTMNCTTTTMECTTLDFSITRE